MTTSPFWRRVRQLRKEIAIKLYMEDHKDIDVYVTPSTRELKEGDTARRSRGSVKPKTAPKS